MTAIAVATDADEVVIGSDTGAYLGDVLKFTHGSKLTRIDEHVVAGAASVRRIQIIEDLLQAKPDLIESSPATLADAILEAHDEAKGVNDDDENWSVLIASPGGVRFVINDGSIMPVHAYFAIGAGAEISMGAMHALWGRAPIREVVRSAIQAAIDHSPHCHAEVSIHAIERV